MIKRKGGEAMNTAQVIPISRAQRLPTAAIKEVIEYVEKVAVKIRENQCPVRTQYYGSPTLIREYLVPVDLLSTDIKSQKRRKGKNSAIVSQLSKQFERDGQSKGICCKVVQDEDGNWEIIIRWGNHRWKAVLNLVSRGSNILGVDQGYVWISIFNEYHADHELNGLQTIENNLQEASEPADDEDNLDSLDQAWKDGELDTTEKFSKLSQEDKQEQLKKWIESFMGANVKQPSRLIKKFFKRNSAKVRTDTKEAEDHQDHWNLYESHNFGGIKFTNAGKRNNTVYYNGKTHAQYHMNGDFWAGATIQQMSHAKLGLLPNQNPKADVVHLVVSLPLNVLKDGQAKIQSRRQEWENAVKHWNQTLGKIVDYLYIMPQTGPEELNSKKGNPWIKKIKF